MIKINVSFHVQKYYSQLNLKIDFLSFCKKMNKTKLLIKKSDLNDVS